MAICTRDLIESIIRPTILGLNMQGDSAERLIAGTIAQESSMGTYLRQNAGIAKGICQMEPATHDDTYTNYLKYHQKIREKLYIVSNLSLPSGFMVPPSDLLIFNLRYSVAMCRIHYYRRAGLLPEPDDIPGMARCWKSYYNTPKGLGKESEFIANYKKYVLPYYT